MRNTAVVTLGQVLAGHQGQQVRRRAGGAGQCLRVEDRQCGQGIMNQLVDQRLPGGFVVPVTGRFARRGVIVVAASASRTCSASGASVLASTINSLRIAARSWVTVSWVATASYTGVESSTRARPLSAPDLLGHHPGVFEHAPLPTTGPQPVALTHQSRRMERLIAQVHTGRRLPAQIHLQAVARLPIRQALEGLQHHHRGHHPGRDGRPTPHRVGVQVGEIAVGKDAMALIGQQPVNRPLRQPLTQHLAGILETGLSHRLTKSHTASIRHPHTQVVDPRPTHHARPRPQEQQQPTANPASCDQAP